VKIFHVQDWVHAVAKGQRTTGVEAEENIKKLTYLNMQRNALIQAIDALDGVEKVRVKI
jgi:hypothetical protein